MELGATLFQKWPSMHEVILSIQFSALPELHNVQMGLLWGEYRAKYPKTQEQPPLPPVFETFGSPGDQIQNPGMNIQFQMFNRPPPVRYWFESENQNDLLQVQQDRMIRNWRKQTGVSPYPGYQEIRNSFRQEIEVFQTFLIRENLGTVQVNQVELTYLNALFLPNSSNPHSDLQSITPLYRNIDFGLEDEGAALSVRYIIKEDDRPIGRLYTTFTPAILGLTGEPNIGLELTARAKPRVETIDAAFELLDRQHQIIGDAFNALVDSGLRKAWENHNG
jgi:uncharacterized protein (TIGR04255 family)